VLSQKMQGNIFGGACGQGCHDSCPIDNADLLTTYYDGHQDSIRGIFPIGRQ
jgi:hypothetical protein